MDVAFRMRGMEHVVLIDACTSGSEPGALFHLQGSDVEHLPPLGNINLHAFRWDHALAFARWLLKDDYPQRIDVYLVEAGQFDPGEPLSAAVDATARRLVDRLVAMLSTPPLAGDERAAADDVVHAQTDDAA